MKEDVSFEKFCKIDALKKGGGTEGERAAAATALVRLEADQPVRITCTIIHMDKAETFYEIRYRDVEGALKTCMLPREFFLRPTRVVEQLLRAGASLPHNNKTACEIITRAAEAIPEATRRITGRSGWYEGESFVYPGETFGKLKGHITYQQPHELDPALGLKAGSLRAWREGLREPCKYSDYLIFCLGQKGSNLLLELIGEEESSILHLHGTETDNTDKSSSSSGKTLATKVAASMTGRCRVSDLPTFSTSETAICDLCFAHNHLGVEIDEKGRSETGSGPRVQTDQLAYLVASGRGAVRSNYATRHADLKNLQWLCSGISSGEKPLDGSSTSGSRPEGVQVRMIGLPVPPGSRGGIFNRVKYRGSKKIKVCKQLAEQAEQTIKNNYGVGFLAFIHAIWPLRDTLRDRMNERIEKLVEKVGAKDPWEARFARHLAIAGATAILLAELDIGPWSEKRAERAFVRMYEKARSAVATVDEIAGDVITRLRRRLSKGRFPNIAKGERPSQRVLERAKKGLIREMPGIGPTLLVSLARFKKLIQGRDHAEVIRHLAQQRIVHLGDGGYLTRQAQVKGLSQGRPRYVCFHLGVLQSAKKRGNCSLLTSRR